MSPKARDVDANRQVNVAKRQSLTSIEADVLQLTMSSETSVVDADKMNVHGRSITKQSYEQCVVTYIGVRTMHHEDFMLWFSSQKRPNCTSMHDYCQVTSVIYA